MSWEAFMQRQRDKERDDPESLVHMANYRQELDRQREERLSAGHNHKDLRRKRKEHKKKKKKDKKKSKKKDKKRKKSGSSSSDLSSDSEPDTKKSKHDAGPVRLSSFLESGDEED